MGDEFDEVIEEFEDEDISDDIEEIEEDEKALEEEKSKELTIDNIANEIMQMCLDDRAKADEVFDLMKRRIENEGDTSQAAKETLARAVEMRTNSSQNLVELLKIKTNLKKVNNATQINIGSSESGIKIKGVDTNVILQKIKNKHGTKSE